MNYCSKVYFTFTTDRKVKSNAPMANPVKTFYEDS